MHEDALCPLLHEAPLRDETWSTEGARAVCAGTV